LSAHATIASTLLIRPPHPTERRIGGQLQSVSRVAIRCIRHMGAGIPGRPVQTTAVARGVLGRLSTLPAAQWRRRPSVDAPTATVHPGKLPQLP